MFIYYHVIGTLQSEDLVILDPVASGFKPEWMQFPMVTNDGRFIFVSVYEGAEPKNKLYYFDLDSLPAGSGRALTRESTGICCSTFVHLINVALVCYYTYSRIQ